MAIGEYKSGPDQPPEITQTDVREQMQSVNAGEYKKYTEQTVDAKLGDPGFFNFVQTTNEIKNGEDATIDTYLEGADFDKLASLAEQYDRDVKPMIDKFQNFLSSEMLGKMKLIKGENQGKAKEAIEAFLGKKAAEDPEGFVSKYTDLFKNYEEKKAKSDALTKELKGRFATADSGKLTQMAAENNIAAEILSKTAKENETTLKDSRGKISKRWFNGLGRLKNTVTSFGKERRSGAEIEEDQAFDAVQNDLNKKIEGLKQGSIDMTKGVKDKAQLDGEIDSIRDEIMADLKGSEELRAITLEAAQAAILLSNGEFNVNDAASTLGEIGDMWSGSFDAQDDMKMEKMLTEVYRKEIQSAAESKEKAINPSKMEQFDTFLASNVSNEQAKQIMKDLIEEALQDPGLDKKSPKAAQLALMRRKANNFDIAAA